MPPVSRLHATHLLALLAMALMVASYPIYKVSGIKELYPFFHWRLFSTPVGWDGTTTYRFYTRATPDAPWQRQTIRPAPGYSLKDYQYQWASLVQEALQDSLGRTEAHERLAVFARLSAPNAAAYRVVAESYDPLTLLDDTTRYDTTTVLRVMQPASGTRSAE